jgi:hypothetical protein
MDVQIEKSLGKAGGQALDKRARHLYGANCNGVSWHSGGGTIPAQATVHLVDGQDPADAETLLTAIALPTCSHASLAITVDVGTLIVADVTNITADPTDLKSVKVALSKDDTTGALEVTVYEKTTGEYGAVPGGKTHVADLKEYTVVAAGSALTEVNDWI